MINHKIIFAISLLFYSVSYCAYVTYKDSISNNFCSRVEATGYAEFKNEDFGIDFYSDLYKSYDDFLALIQSNDEIRDLLDQAEVEFLSNEQNIKRFEDTFYQGNSHLSSDDQPYFKFTKEYLAFLNTRYSQLMEYSAIKNFIENMSKINKKAYYLSTEMVNLLDQKYKGISKNFYDNQELYVVTKIIRYKRVEEKIEMRAEAHYDRSAFTILWDSNDNKYDKLVVAKNVKNKYLEELILPKRSHVRSNNSTSALIISGAACKYMTSDIKPLLHAVLPFNQDYRYAVVSFLVPYINYQMPEVKIHQKN